MIVTKNDAIILFFLVGHLLSTLSLAASDDAFYQSETSSHILLSWQEEYHLQDAGISPDHNLDITPETVDLLDDELSFTPYDQLSYDLRTHQYYWGKFQLQNKVSDGENYQEWILQFSSTVTEIDLYAEQSDGTYRQYKSGEFVPYRLKSFKPTLDMNLFRITLPKDEVIQFYFRAQAERQNVPPDFDISLQHTTVFSTSLKEHKIFHYFLFGFFAMMILYSLTGAVIKQDRSFVYYSLYVIVLGTHAANSSGHTEDWFGFFLFPESPKFAYLFNTMILVGFMAYIGFIRSFLNLSQLMPRWDRFYRYLFWFCIPIIILHLVVAHTSNYSHGVADFVIGAYGAIFLISSVVFTYQLYWTKDKKGFFIVAGMVFILIDLCLNLLSLLEFIHYPLLNMKIGFVAEILIFSLGLAYREQENVKAKEQANFELEKTKFLQVQEQEELDQLKKLNDLKSQLYTNITHEFRTPLTVIMGMNDNIKGHDKERSIIHRNSEDLLRMINQLLDLSKAESASLEVHKSNGDIVSFLKFMTESFYSMATDKGVRLTFYAEVASIETLFDEVKVQHIFYNLLSNAIKFTDDGGKVILHVQQVVEEGQDHLKIKIQDTGIGIPEDQLPHIFDRFYQGDNSNTRQGEGTGIGLALVKELVQLMDGRIEVSSNQGIGTEFTIWLPIDVIQVGTQELSTSQNLSYIPVGDPGTGEPNDYMLSQGQEDLPILLIIEDNKDVATYIQSVLEKDYHIHLAKNGLIGIEKAISIIPDIIISDVMMPIKDGYEVCDTLKQDERTNHIPIILLTAKATQADRVAGLQLGADAFLTKPFQREELLVRLETLTSLRHTLQERYSQGANGPIADNEGGDLFLIKIRTLVESEMDNSDFSVSDLGAALHMSDMQVYRKLKALTNQTPSAFIRSVRLTKGKQLLQETELTIAEIAYEIGFNNPNYFSRTFHKAFGRPPSEYRK